MQQFCFNDFEQITMHLLFVKTPHKVTTYCQNFNREKLFQKWNQSHAYFHVAIKCEIYFSLCELRFQYISCGQVKLEFILNQIVGRFRRKNCGINLICPIKTENYYKFLDSSTKETKIKYENMKLFCAAPKQFMKRYQTIQNCMQIFNENSFLIQTAIVKRFNFKSMKYNCCTLFDVILCQYNGFIIEKTMLLDYIDLLCDEILSFFFLFRK